MRRNPEVDAVLTELRTFGIKHQVDETGKHPQVIWFHKRKKRIVTCGKTASDHRALANNRALVRRMLREDGIDVDAGPKPAPRVTSLEKAIQTPIETDTTPDRLAKVETELKMVTDLLLSIAPAFDPTNDIVRATQAADQYSVRVPRGKLGYVLAALLQTGMSPAEIRVSPIFKTAAANGHVNIPNESKMASDEDVIRSNIVPYIQRVLAVVRGFGPASYADIHQRLGGGSKIKLNVALAKLKEENKITQAGRRQPYSIVSLSGYIPKANGHEAAIPN